MQKKWKMNGTEREIWIMRVNDTQKKKHKRKEWRRNWAQEWYVPQCSSELIIGIIFELAQWHTFREMGTDFTYTHTRTHSSHTASLSTLFADSKPPVIVGNCSCVFHSNAKAPYPANQNEAERGEKSTKMRTNETKENRYVSRYFIRGDTNVCGDQQHLS